MITHRLAGSECESDFDRSTKVGLANPGAQGRPAIERVKQRQKFRSVSIPRCIILSALVAPFLRTAGGY
jgi:hypothetical protein